MSESNLFLVRINTLPILFRSDPRPGFKGDVEEGITLLPLPHSPDDYRWSDGAEVPKPHCHGRDGDNPKVVHEFRNGQELREAGAEFLGAPMLVFDDWEEFQQAAWPAA